MNNFKYTTWIQLTEAFKYSEVPQVMDKLPCIEESLGH